MFILSSQGSQIINIEKIISRSSAIFGNLPYNISSQILVSILRVKKYPPKFNDLIFMFQKELGEKIIGSYPSLHYGRLSILVKYRLESIFLEKYFTISFNLEYQILEYLCLTIFLI